VAPWDEHPNALGHRLVASKLYDLLRQNKTTIPIGLNGPANADPVAQE
jgi:hypothetical protein